MTYLANKMNDANDLGYFATYAALVAAYPTGVAGVFAIVGSTDTVWVWDTGTGAWVDTGTAGAGTVTSVAALTLGTTGIDLSSTVATGTTTPVITLHVPTASATNRGALSAADWSTFNGKGSGTVTAVSVATANGVSGSSSGGATPALTIALGVITPTSINGLTLASQAIGFTIAGGATSKTLTVPLDASISGTNTGDQTNITGNAATATNLGGGAGGSIPYQSAASTTAMLSNGTVGQVLTSAGTTLAPTWTTPAAAGTGTVTSVSVVTANGISGTVATATTTPAITLAVATQAAGDSTTNVATTAFVQQAVRSVPSKEASKYATTTALAAVTYYNGVANDGVGATLTGVGLGAITLDGNTPIVGDRLLVKNQASTFQNGIYTVTIVGTAGTVFVLTRALDFNQSIDIKTGASTYVTSGTTLAATTWDVNSADSPVMGTDAITFIQSAGPGSIIAGTGISISGVTVAIDSTVATLTGSQALTNKTYNGNTFTAGTGTLTIAASKVLTASNTLTLAGTDGTTMTFPAISANVCTVAVTTETTNTATVVAIGGTNHTHTITALASADTIGVPTIAAGSLTDANTLIFRFLDNATARALTWNAIFVPRGVALPTTTVLSKYLYVGFKYNVAATKWDCLAVDNEA